MPKAKTWILILALILTACQSSGPAEPTLKATLPPTPQATDTPTLTPTETPTNTPAPTDTPTPSPTPEVVDYGPDNFPTDVNPLTGLKVSEPKLLERRPVSVKIQTFPRGQRPPWAISLADIVYDYYQNNGLTRLNALFYTNNAEQVGPVRSARLFDGIITRMYKTIFAFGGADRRILNRLFNTEYADRLILEGGGICPAMCRVDPNGFNYLVVNTEELGKYAVEQGVEDTRQELDGMTFQAEPPEGGLAGDQVSVRYSISSYTRWDYDPSTGRYLRFQDSVEDTGGGEQYEPFLDRNTDEQVAADNVVVLFVIHEYVYRSGNSEIVDILLSGSGTAYAFRDGQAYQLLWNRPTLESVVYLTFPDGTRYPYKQGTTWYQVIGQSSTIPEKEGNWRFEFRIP